MRDAIVTAVDEAFDEQVTFTADLTAQPSRMGAEAGAQALMADLMRDKGLDDPSIFDDPTRVNLVIQGGVVVKDTR